MKKVSIFSLVSCLFVFGANAGYDDSRVRQEVLDGLDIVSARNLDDNPYEEAPGELGADVYQTFSNKEINDYDLNIPTTMYVRGGVGMNLGFATGNAKVGDVEVSPKSGFNTVIGLGWNLSSYVRTEIDFQSHTLNFDGIDDSMESRGVGGTLYFDLARRYIRTGDVTRRRTVVPFMGFGAGVGTYKFQGGDGETGIFAAPRGVFGVNVMLTNLIGLDLSYQYQLFVNNGFGWGNGGGAKSVSDVMASFRVNF